MRQFKFEEPLYEKLDLMPLDVRRRSDLAGVRLSLAGWQALTFADRLTLGQLAVDTDAEVRAYRAFARALMDRAKQPMKEESPAAPWRDVDATARVTQRAGALGRVLDPARWAALDDPAKYALYRLAGSTREPSKFEAALDELLPPR